MPHSKYEYKEPQGKLSLQFQKCDVNYCPPKKNKRIHMFSQIKEQPLQQGVDRMKQIVPTLFENKRKKLKDKDIFDITGKAKGTKKEPVKKMRYEKEKFVYSYKNRI